MRLSNGSCYKLLYLAIYYHKYILHLNLMEYLKKVLVSLKYKIKTKYFFLVKNNLIGVITWHSNITVI